jgi:hypothetical protein
VSTFLPAAVMVRRSWSLAVCTPADVAPAFAFVAISEYRFDVPAFSEGRTNTAVPSESIWSGRVFPASSRSAYVFVLMMLFGSANETTLSLRSSEPAATVTYTVFSAVRDSTRPSEVINDATQTNIIKMFRIFVR